MFIRSLLKYMDLRCFIVIGLESWIIIATPWKDQGQRPEDFGLELGRSKNAGPPSFDILWTLKGNFLFWKKTARGCWGEISKLQIYAREDELERGGLPGCQIQYDLRWVDWGGIDEEPFDPPKRGHSQDARRPYFQRSVRGKGFIIFWFKSANWLWML